MRKRYIGALLLILVLLISGCKNAEEEKGTNIYYMDPLGSGLVVEKHEIVSKSREKQAKEMLELLAKDPVSPDYRRTIPEGVEISDIMFDKGSVNLNFNHNYSEISGYKEALIRAAVVKTLTQIKGVESVTFYVGDAPLQDSRGVLVGGMTSDTFIDDYGKETDSLSQTDLVLYFASADGKSLVKKNVKTYYNSNVARERAIVENLIKGTGGEEAKSPIPQGTKLLNITVTDGVCYVNFDNSFLNVDSGIAPRVMLYGIVNSLTELDSINRVQILVNGASAVPEKELDFKLGTSYERDTSMIMEAIENTQVEEDEVN